MSALCQFRTRAAQQIAFLFDHVVSELIEIEGDIYYRCAVKIDFGIMPWMPLVPSTTCVT
jgi:hypothetical protein